MQYFEHILVGVADLPSFDIKIYPNPVSDFIKIECEENIERIEILNSAGNHVVPVNDQKKQISLKDLTPGVYIVKVTSDEGYFTTRKIYKQ